MDLPRTNIMWIKVKLRNIIGEITWKMFLISILKRDIPSDLI